MASKPAKRQSNSVARRRDNRTETKSDALSHGFPVASVNHRPMLPGLAWKFTGNGWQYVILS